MTRAEVLTPIMLRGREVSTDVWYESWRNDLAEKCRRAEKGIIYIRTPVCRITMGAM